ncbi:xanthine dehydrogenase family protein molybdopterin-binding subunit [Pleomorphovibrio marinus]|uniref:xanthine dehydrogenase family protein molybdopterin-binding subunit n=1 Tax=Pleomorphovibrio marinus TaxID=2164132 RepID=UPI001E2BE773|nr:molybdopterin cofactor-binding domain-containing protein [Pleomorphovibrio marinus]
MKNDFSGNSRRAFLKQVGLGLGTFVLYSDLIAFPSDQRKIEEEDSIASFIHVAEDGHITAYSGKTEVGQNIRTSLAQVVAEELRVPFEMVDMVLADTKLTPYDRGTTGSRTTPQMSLTLRKAAATLREMLKEEASDSWQIGKTSLSLEGGAIAHPSNGKRLTYAELANGKRLFEPYRDNVELTPVNEWKIAGTSVPKARGRDYVTGKHKYVSDLSLPNMQYGKILRPPVYGAKLKSLDISQVKSMEGVQVVRNGDFVGVTAPDATTASQALALLDASWDSKEHVSRKNLFDHLVKHANLSEKELEFEALNGFEDRLEQEFHIDYISHVPLETRVGVAEWDDDELTVWTGTQKPFGVQEDLCNEFSISKAKVRVITPDTGSGYGGKHTAEAGVEAAKLAKGVEKPVKVQWTREEEFKWAYFRPAGVIQVKSALESNGNLGAWQFHNFNSGGSGMQTPYRVKEKQEKYHRSDTPLRQGSYRALASTANVFAIESQMTDLAYYLKEDSLAFRLRHLDDPRMKDVLIAAAEKFHWENKLPQGRGKGLGCGYVKGGYVATFAEVAFDKESQKVVVKRLVTAFECGAIIHPKHLKSQVVGCVLQGLGGALFEAVDFEDGKINNASLSTYRVPKFSDIPEVEVVLLNRKDLDPAGAGEAPILGVAPAIRNAILDASGKRINRLPMIPDGKV